MPHYMVILHALFNLIFSFTVAFNNNKIILKVIYTRNVSNKSKAYNLLNTYTFWELFFYLSVYLYMYLSISFIQSVIANL